MAAPGTDPPGDAPAPGQQRVVEPHDADAPPPPGRTGSSEPPSGDAAGGSSAASGGSFDAEAARARTSEGSGSGAQRAGGFLLAGPEKRLLEALAGRLPGWMTPDHLTLVGIVGFALVAAGVVAGGREPWGALLAVVGLVVNWAGDSLDGTLARVRAWQRPRYGYYLDHLVDAFGVSIVAIALAASPLATAWVALTLGILYLAAEIIVLLEASVRDEFSIGFGTIGPTEGRIALAVGFVVLWAWNPPDTIVLFDVRMSPLDPALLIAIAGLGLSAVLRAYGTLRELGAAEPPRGG